MKKQNLKQELEETAKAELAKGGFDGTLEVEELEETPCFKASIDAQELNHIEIGFNPVYEQEKPGKAKVVVRDLSRHEVNHKGYKGFHGCPRTLENHAELIIEPIADVLLAKGFSLDDVHYAGNALEDTILHDDLTKSFTLEGQVGFWEDIGRHEDFTDFYEAYTKLNLFLWGRKQDKKELQKYWKHPDKVAKVLQGFLEKTGLSNLKQTVNNQEVRNREQLRAYLVKEENWPKVAKIFAQEFSKLMKPGYALPLANHSGKGTKGKEVKGKEAKVPTHIEGNPFDRAMYTPRFKKTRIAKAYSKGEEVPSWMDNFEALDLLYQNLAQKLNIKAETFTKQTSMPVFHYGKRPFDPDRDNLKHVTFGFGDKGEVELKKKRWHEDMPLEYKVNPKGFPEIRFCLLDTSGSMASNPDGGRNIGKTSIIPWGDNSKYHYALLGWYGLLEYLKENHLLKQTGISLGNFGDETYIKHGLAEAKKLALNPQLNSSSTDLDMDEVKKLFRSQGMLIFTISDGWIDNWSSIKDDFIKQAKQHHYFHLQIGAENQTTKDLKKAGLYVEYIKNAKDLAEKVIDLTDKLYRI